MATFRTQLNQNQDGNILLSLPIFNIPLKTNINEYNNNNVIEHSKKGFINTSFDHGESSGRGHRAQSSLQPQPMYGIKYEESQPGYCALKKKIQFKWL